MRIAHIAQACSEMHLDAHQPEEAVALLQRVVQVLPLTEPLLGRSCAPTSVSVIAPWLRRLAGVPGGARSGEARRPRGLHRGASRRALDVA